MAVQVPYPLPIHQDEVLAHQVEADFAKLRKLGPLVRAEFPFGGEGWIATRYEEVRFVLADPRFSVAEAARRGDHPRIRVYEGGPDSPPAFPMMDPPEYTKHRAVLAKHLTVTRVQQMRPATVRIVDDCLEQLEKQGSPVDLVPGLTRRVPVMVLCHMLGVPLSDSSRFLDTAAAMSNARLTDPAEVQQKLAVVDTYLRELVDLRRETPGDDLISALIHDIETAEIWADEELYGIGTLLLLAGHDAAASMLGGIVQWLVHDPDSAAALRADPTQVPRAIDEFVRFLPVGLAGTKSRIAMEDVQVGEILVKKGEAVLPILHAANFDEAVFEDPGTLRLDRQAQPHVGFGFGPHSCPGSQLARMQIEIALERLLTRFDHLRPAAENPHWRQEFLLRGPKQLNVAWR